MKKKAIIISIKGFKLTYKEKFLLSKNKPWGLILFKRNIESFSQINNLIIQIRKTTNDKKFPILIDEEGSSVSRLSNVFNHSIDANFFGDLYKINKKNSIILYKYYLRLLCKNLKKVGVNINTIPVLDVLRKNTNKVIGKRSFSENKKIVETLGEITTKECRSQKIITVIKHIPGHGCSTVDSHLRLPKINLSINNLKKLIFIHLNLIQLNWL